MTGALRNLGWIVLGLAALVQAGCALAIAGAAAGAGAAGYVYYRGLIYRDYHGNLDQTAAAVRAALAELQLPLVREQNEEGSASSFLRARTGTGDTVRIYLDVVAGAIPAEGTITRVGIRVGVTGDDEVSIRILDQISKRLSSPAAPDRVTPIPQTTAPPPALGTPQPARETTAPPLAPVPATGK